MKTKEQLQEELYKLEKQEAEIKKQKELEKNYQAFLDRDPDLIIGKAHSDIGITQINYRWSDGNFYTIGNAISIHGNMGTTYNARAPITSATHTYFHNVWTDKQRAQFQQSLNKVAIKEVNKIMGSLRNVLEIMGLQSTSFFLNNIYPKNKIEEIKKDIENERNKVLDTYKDKDFLELLKKNRYGGESLSKETDLSHSNIILFRYIFSKRPKLQKEFSKTKFFDNWSKEILN